jgi:hypothetical protein
MDSQPARTGSRKALPTPWGFGLRMCELKRSRQPTLMDQKMSDSSPVPAP